MFHSHSLKQKRRKEAKGEKKGEPVCSAQLHTWVVLDEEGSLHVLYGQGPHLAGVRGDVPHEGGVLRAEGVPVPRGGDTHTPRTHWGGWGGGG